MAGNYFDQFDAKPSGNFFDQFDEGAKPPAPGGFVASAKQSVGSLIKGAGQAAADFVPGVGQDNAVKQYGQSVIDANPTAVKSLGDIADKPGTAVKEAAGNAAGSVGAMVGARALGQGITALAPAVGAAFPLAAPITVPATVGAGQAISWLGPWAAAALPSFGGIREQQIKDDPSKTDDPGAKALAAAGAGTVGLIENKFGPQEWAMRALTKEGRTKLAEKFAANSVAGSIGKGVARGAAVEGAEELVQNPIEQLAAYQDPTTAENVQDTLFGSAMGGLGGGVFGGGFGAASRGAHGSAGQQQSPAKPPLLPAPPDLTGTPGDQMQQAEARRADAVLQAEARTAEIYRKRADEEFRQGVLNEPQNQDLPPQERETLAAVGDILQGDADFGGWVHREIDPARKEARYFYPDGRVRTLYEGGAETTYGAPPKFDQKPIPYSPQPAEDLGRPAQGGHGYRPGCRTAIGRRRHCGGEPGG